MKTGRIVAQHRDRYFLSSDTTEHAARIDGRLLQSGNFPAVGDYVRYEDATDPALISEVLPRTSKLVRKSAGSAVTAQVVAANMDWVFIMCGLDDDFSVRRIERYLAAVWESGAQPVILLNKADACDDLPARLSEVVAVAPDVPVHALCLIDGSGIDALAPYLQAGATVALVGSSGTGKSTLVNLLAQGNLQATGAVREHDSRGRHTTTSRRLIALPGGASLIDTPGMRELQPWDAAAGIDHTFAEIAALAAQCRFRDCTHTTEPECAVLAATNNDLDEARLGSYQKLRREAEYLERKADAGAQAAEKARWKSIHKEMRRFAKRRGR